MSEETEKLRAAAADKMVEEGSEGVEERLGSVLGLDLAQVRAQEQLLSEVTGTTVEDVKELLERGDHRTVSNLVAVMNTPASAVREQKRHTANPRDSIKRTDDSGTADLRMAEEIGSHGTSMERKTHGTSDGKHQEITNQHADIGEFEFNMEGLSSAEAEKRLGLYGPNTLPEHVDSKLTIFLKQLWSPMPVMIWLAIAIEIVIGNFIDMGILLFIQVANASISFYETTKAGNAVAALKSDMKAMATVKRDGNWLTIDASYIVPGDLLMLGSGWAVPADCRINDSNIDVDQAALTGESLPVTLYKGDSCKMGSTVVRGEVEATVEFTGSSTILGKTAGLLASESERSHLQTVLFTITSIMVSLSLVLCTINLLYLIAAGKPFNEALSYTIVLLVTSLPLAIEIVTTTTLAIGSKSLAMHGAIVANLSAIQDLAGMSILVADKTGTLTVNKMELQDDTPIFCSGENQESVLVLAALATKWKEPARDALDRLTLSNVNVALLDQYEQLDFMPFDPTVKRTEGTVRNNSTGETFKVTKGAPHILLDLLGPSEAEVMERVENEVARLGGRGIRSLAVARTDSTGKWLMVGLLTFLDPPRSDTKHTISEAKSYGVNVKMATGDHLLIATNMSRELGMGNHVFTAERLPLLDEVTKKKPANLSRDYGDLILAADGFAQVYPEHKYLIVECLRELGHTIGMTGDGVNDAPALKRSDIGIAVAGATDAARAAADIILTREGLSTIVESIQVARQIFQRVNSFITYRVASTLQLLLFFFIAVIAFHPHEYEQPPQPDDGGEWPEFFDMPVTMMILITLLNDGTLVSIAYDNAEASPAPTKWNLPVLFSASAALGFVSCVSSLILLWFMLDSWNDSGVFGTLGLEGVQYGQIMTAMYLKVSVSDFLTLFSARTGAKFFWQGTMPATPLLAGGVFALTLSSIVAIFWPVSDPDSIPVEGLHHDMGLFVFVWIYSLFFWVLQDGLKVVMFRWMRAINFNNCSESGALVLPESAKRLIEGFDVALQESDNINSIV